MTRRWDINLGSVENQQSGFGLEGPFNSGGGAEVPGRVSEWPCTFIFPRLCCCLLFVIVILVVE